MTTSTDHITELISRHYRGMIRTGRLEPGSRLPSTQELAERWQTHAPVVQVAMAALVKEGLLKRTPGVGTVVLDVPAGLSHVGVLLPQGLFEHVEGAYMRRLCHEIERQLCDTGKMSTFIIRDPLPRGDTDSESIHLPRELIEKADRRDIQAVVVPVSSAEEVPVLRKLPVPVSVVTGMDVPFRISFDDLTAVEQAMRALKEKGCRRVGIIDVHALAIEHQPGVCTQARLHHLHVRQCAESMGLEMREEWTINAVRGDELLDVSHERYGYESFMRIWRREGPKPDALFVNEDIVARGALMAILQLRVDVPRQLQLAVYQNKGLNMLCPLPATFIEWDVARIAGALLEQVERQFAGDIVSPLIIQPEVFDHMPDFA